MLSSQEKQKPLFCAENLEVLKVQVKAELNFLIKETQDTSLFILQSIMCVFKPFSQQNSFGEEFECFTESPVPLKKLAV